MKNLCVLIIAVSCFGNVYSQTAEEFYNTGIKKYELHDYKGAIIYFTKAIKLDSNNETYFANRGIAHSYNNNKLEAVKDLTKALVISPNDSELYSARAKIKLDLLDLRGSILDFNRAIEINPIEKDFEDRGLVYLLLKDYKNSIIDNTKAIEINGSNSNAYYNRAIAKLALNFKDDDYCLDLSKAGELGDQLAYELIKKHCN